MKGLQYQTATSSTYKINVANSKFVNLFQTHHTPTPAGKTNYQRYMILKKHLDTSMKLLSGL
jgi:hypothetical protein